MMTVSVFPVAIAGCELCLVVVLWIPAGKEGEGTLGRLVPVITLPCICSGRLLRQVADLICWQKCTQQLRRSSLRGVPDESPQ